MNLRNVIKNNYKFLEDDISSAFNLLKARPKENKELFWKENRREVLYLYRHILKYIPPMCERKLERVHLYEKIKFMFREGSREDDIESIKLLKNTGYTVIEKVNKGVYPPFPKFQA